VRETFKSLAVFSASLLLILTVSSGCSVNIPGCGKRSLPLFKPVVENIQTIPASKEAPTDPSAAVPTASAAAPSVAPSAASLKPVSASQAAVVGSPTPTPQPILESERIAYTTFENGKSSLYDMATSGTDPQRRNPVGSNAWFPLWSPNGKILAFLSDIDGKANLYVQDKGSNQSKQLTFYEDLEIPTEDSSFVPFTWSPKSDQIVLIYRHQLVLVDLTQISQVSLTTVDPLYQILSLEWAPRRSDRYIAFMVRQGDHFNSLRLVNPRLHDGIVLSEVRDTAGPISWSPDASKVAYLIGDKSLYEVSYETLKAKLLFQSATNVFGSLLQYSPSEGKSDLLLLARKNDDDKGFRVALLDKPATSEADKGSLIYLTEPGVQEASWSPDGSKIMYTIDGSLWVMDANGGNKKRVSLDVLRTPDWSKK